MSYLARLTAPRRIFCAVAAALSLLGCVAGYAQTTTGGNALTGQGLFDANCKACHGNTNPAVGILNVQKATTATALQAAITTNSPTMKLMPSLAGLSSVQLADIAAYVAADVAASATGNVANGRALYAGTCAACHGPAPASGNARVNLGVSAAVIQNAMVKFPVAMSPTAGYDLRFNLSATQLDDVAAFIAADVTAGTASTSVDRGSVLYTAMCSRCHGGAANGGEHVAKATNSGSTLSAIARNKGHMGSLAFVTNEQASDIAAYIAAAGPSGGLAGLMGGCTLGRSNQPMDPLWLLLLIGSVWVLRARRAVKV
ncbi:MAG: cytochrome c [Leptothrix ochracea]|uniref:c-type cytochrome n=1 Tax=Leptothrix ochracea TaxID=735331 RepID=UPI0034E2ECBD